jgi:hypothetical protein
MKNEARIVRAMLEELKATPVKTFPERGRPDAPQRQGVYIIYSPHGKIAHVGRIAGLSMCDGSLLQ